MNWRDRKKRWLEQELAQMKEEELKLGFAISEAQDRRLAFQSIFSSLCRMIQLEKYDEQLIKTLKDKSFEIVDEIFEKYKPNLEGIFDTVYDLEETMKRILLPEEFENWKKEKEKREKEKKEEKEVKKEK